MTELILLLYSKITAEVICSIAWKREVKSILSKRKRE